MVACVSRTTTGQRLASGRLAHGNFAGLCEFRVDPIPPSILLRGLLLERVVHGTALGLEDTPRKRAAAERPREMIAREPVVDELFAIRRAHPCVLHQDIEDFLGLRPGSFVVHTAILRLKFRTIRGDSSIYESKIQRSDFYPPAKDYPRQIFHFLNSGFFDIMRKSEFAFWIRKKHSAVAQW